MINVHSVVFISFDQGDTYCFSKLEDAVRGALFIFECIPDDLTMKQETFKCKLLE